MVFFTLPSPIEVYFELKNDEFSDMYEDEMAVELLTASGPAEWLERMRRHIANRAGSENDNNTAAAIWVEL